MDLQRLFNSTTELQLLREVCRKNFYQFCREFWETIVSTPCQWNWHHEYICQKLQDTVEDVLEGRPKKHDLIISLPPGTGKCECAGSRIATPCGYRFIENIIPGDVVISQFNGFRSVRSVNEIHSFFSECVEVIHHHAPPHTYSKNHPFLTQRGWVEAAQLLEGDYVQVAMGEQFQPVAIPDAELDFKTSTLFKVRCLSKHKRLPESFFSLPLPQKYRFIGLMIATVGRIAKTGEFQITLASRGLIEDIQLFLLSCNIASRVNVKKSKFKDKKTGKTFIGDAWCLRFCTEHLESPYCWSKVEAVKPAGTKRVYGLTLNGESYDENNYLSNNVVVHNSSLLSILLPSYLHARNPAFRFITSSFDQDLANNFGTLSRKVMDSELYRKLFYQFKYTPNRIDHYRNQYGGERMIFQTGQSPTGRHANLIIMDDLIDPMSMTKEKDIQKTNFYMNSVIRPRVINIESTPLILIMQRLHEQDPVSEWLSHKDAKILHISLPAKIDIEHQPHPIGLKRYYRNGLLDPLRLSEAALADRRTWMPQADYEAQYLQNPLPTGGLMFKIAMIGCHHIDPLDPIVQVVRYWDKAISVSDTACFTAGVKVGRTMSGRFAILDVRRGRWGLYEREQLIRNTAEADGIACLIGLEIEPGSGGMADSQSTVRHLAGFVVIPEKPPASKEVRARPFAIQVEQGNVFMTPGNWNTEFIDEIAAFPTGSRYKDQVDAVSAAFNLLSQQITLTASAF